MEAARAWARAHPVVADSVLALALLAAALVSAHVTVEVNQAGSPSYRPPATPTVVAGLAATFVPLAARRRWPLGVLLVCTGGFVAARVVFESLEAAVSVLALGLAVYSAAAHGRPRWRSPVCAASVAVLMTELWREVVTNAPPIENLLVYQAFTLSLNLVLLSAMWALGAAVARGAATPGSWASARRSWKENVRPGPGGPCSTSGCASPASCTTWWRTT